MRKKLEAHERRLLREEAGRLLSDFLFAWRICLWESHVFLPEEETHFQMEIIRPLQEDRERQRRKNPSGRKRKLTRKERQERKEAGELYISFCNILTTTAKKKIPSSSDLQPLADALNRTIESLDFYGGDAPGGGPYAASKVDTIRAIGDMLLRYLNVTHRCGPAHALCVVCGGLMTAGRGGKKVCSPACRSSKYFSYAARKDYRKRLGESRKALGKTANRR